MNSVQKLPSNHSNVIGQQPPTAEVLVAVSFRNSGKSLVQVENILRRGRYCLLYHLHFHATMYVGVLASTVVVRERSLVALYMRPDGILSPLWWTSLHLRTSLHDNAGWSSRQFLPIIMM